MALRVSRPKWKDVSPELRLVLERYPRVVELPDGAQVRLRPLVGRDEPELVQLFINIPYEDLRNLHDNVSDPVIVRRWCRNINYDRMLPIVAELEGKIVADATLKRHAAGPTRGVGRFRAYVHPEYRRRGLGAVLLREILDLARAMGMRQLAVDLYQGQRELRKMFLRYGFHDEGLLPVCQRVTLVREVAAEEDEAATPPARIEP
jgi:GNAT superfamily N-acetyltransferase